MSEERKWQRREKRARTHFKFYSEQYLIGGSTRVELEPDERSVWVDFLCLGSMNFGRVEIYSQEHTARQLNIPLELLNRSIKKFLRYGKVKRKYDKREKKEIFTIVKWSHFQADYLTKRLKKASENERSEKDKKGDAEILPTLNEMRPHNTTPNEISSEESQNGKSPNPHLNSSSFSLGENSNEKKQEFLSLLRNRKDYPFNEVNDAIMFEILAIKHPNVDVIYQLKRKIEWWEKKASPTGVKCKPRTQLFDHFEKAFNKKEGPEKVGDIAEKFVVSEEMKDKIAWLENEIRRSEAKR